MYEIARFEIFEGISAEVDSLFRNGLVDKLSHIIKVLPEFLEGKFDSFLKVYEEWRQEAITNFVLKVTGDASRAARVIMIDDRAARNATVLDTLEGYPVEMSRYNRIMRNIDEQETIILEKLRAKYALLGDMRSDPTEIMRAKSHIAALLTEAMQWQKQNIIPYAGPVSLKDLVSPRIPEKMGEKEFFAVTPADIARYGVIFPAPTSEKINQ